MRFVGSFALDSGHLGPFSFSSRSFARLLAMSLLRLWLLWLAHGVLRPVAEQPLLGIFAGLV